MRGEVVSVNSAPQKGDKKLPVTEINCAAGFGVEGDAHAGSTRQLSLLAQESIDKATAAGVGVGPGDFGENVTTQGIDLLALNIGDRLRIGADVIVQISEIGKTCITPCTIGQRLGECIMPREGMFADIMKGGRISSGDPVEQTSAKVGAVLTSSDRCAGGQRTDESGPLLCELLRDLDIVQADYCVLPDEQEQIASKMIHWADRCRLDLILTTGGTGFGPRDRTPDATLVVIDSPASGIAEAIRHEGLKHTPFACLSRGVSGLRGRTLIINLPGSVRAVRESLDLLRTVLPHALEVARDEVTDG